MLYKWKKRITFSCWYGVLCSFSFFAFFINEVHIASMNVNEVNNNKKEHIFFEEIEQKNIDNFFLQETHSSVENEVDWMKEFSGLSVLSRYSNISGGVVVLFNTKFKLISYVKSSQVTFIYIALFTIQIVSKQLHSNNMKIIQHR